MPLPGEGSEGIGIEVLPFAHFVMALVLRVDDCLEELLVAGWSTDVVGSAAAGSLYQPGKLTFYH